MEDTLGEFKYHFSFICNLVLILVLMEDTLGAKIYESFISEVLIIIKPTNSAFVNTN